MKKLTRQQRHMAYMIMLAEWETNSQEHIDFGFCSMIDDLFDIWVYNNLIKYHFPELWAKRGINRIDEYWFNTSTEGWVSRIALLKQCIEETYDPF